MRWTLLQISEPMLAALGARVDPVARVAGVSIDSRTIRGGELFFAIHGPRHDGHDHVAAALECGALAAVVAGLRNRCVIVASLSTTPFARCTGSRPPCASHGARKLPASRAAWARPLQKR